MSRFSSNYYKDLPNYIIYVIKVMPDVIVANNLFYVETLQITERMPADN
jgi:hypothetical protein